MKTVLIFGACGAGLKTLAKAIGLASSSINLICVTSTEPQTEMEGTVATDQPSFEEHLIRDTQRLIEDIEVMEQLDYDRCYIIPEKEKFFISNHIVKNKPIIRNHRIQTRNQLKQRIRIDEKKS